MKVVLQQKELNYILRRSALCTRYLLIINIKINDASQIIWQEVRQPPTYLRKVINNYSYKVNKKTLCFVYQLNSRMYWWIQQLVLKKLIK